MSGFYCKGVVMKYGPETQSAHERRVREGFYEKYCQGEGLDIGYKGSYKEAQPVDNAIGVELDYPGYDGLTLPFPDDSKDFVFSSHCLEHIDNYQHVIKDYFRVLKVGGYLLISVPHMFLYEKKREKPSRWNGDHRRFYTPASLMSEIEESLEPNTYRVRLLKDCDEGFNYILGPMTHSCGEYQIELVLEKINKPIWDLD